MKINFRNILFTLICVFFLLANANAQPLGFGCLGLSGFYAGYSQESFSTPGVNEFINQQLAALDPDGKLFTDKIEFNKGTGYRIGANFVRARFSNFFFSAKGYYQFLKETHETTGQIQNVSVRENFQLTMNHWGVGLDFGIKIFSLLDWKIAEGEATFFNAEFIQETFFDNVSHGGVKYTPKKNKISYFLGTGVILHLIPDYISVEGTAGYNFITIDNMNNSDTTFPPVGSDKKAVDKGEFSATIQLNVGFPL
jgi:hypothetical protein